MTGYYVVNINRKPACRYAGVAKKAERFAKISCTCSASDPQQNLSPAEIAENESFASQRR